MGQLQEEITKHRPGDVVSVSFMRDKKKMTKQVTLRNAQGTTTELKEADPNSLGIDLKPLTAQMKKELALDYGLLVTAIRDGKMKDAGITKGIIIMQVNDKKMNTKDDFEEIVKKTNLSSDRVLWIRAKTQSGINKSFTVDLEDAKKEIGSYCDLILSHNRKILIRADDSVMDWFEGKPYMIRRSRGFAPLPVMVSKEGEVTSLAIGGELKNTFCIGKNRLLYLSSYVGDMADIRTVNALKESVGRMQELLEAQPRICVSDMHPRYNTVAAAEETGLPLVKLQHHYAHILSCMAENDVDEKVIGVSFDGTGYGTDGTIWGGEILLCDTHGFERAGSIKPFRQVGGYVSSKEGWRIAVQLIRDSLGENAWQVCSKLGLCDEKTFKLQSVMADKEVNTVVSTSAGRLFDAVSAILGIRNRSTFEGESSMCLEFAAERFEKKKAMCDTISVEEREENGFVTLDTTALAGEIAQRYLKGEDAEKLAYAFHLSLADAIVKCCENISRKTGVKKCALSGGVFQNKLLLKLTKQSLEALGSEVLIHSLVPANDGGIALGQAYYALCNIEK